jgi:hypothetical protein
MKTIVVDKITLQVLTRYYGSSCPYPGIVDPINFIHLNVPNALDIDCVHVVLNNGELQVVIDETLKELKEQVYWTNLRSLRNKKLTECDWTQTSDAPLDLSTKEQWRVYRQLLRDLPESIVDIHNPIWPMMPSQ